MVPKQKHLELALDCDPDTTLSKAPEPPRDDAPVRPSRVAIELAVACAESAAVEVTGAAAMEVGALEKTEPKAPWAAAGSGCGDDTSVNSHLPRHLYSPRRIPLLEQYARP